MLCASFSLAAASAAESTNPDSKSDLEQRVFLLEERLSALEAAVHNKLGSCEMRFVHHAQRHDACDRGTFAYKVTSLSGGRNLLACGHYQLQCYR